MYKVLFLLFLYCYATAYGEIYEAKHFKEIQSYLVPGTVVVLDIDDTLLVPKQMLGCDEWFQCRLCHHQKTGLNTFESLEKSLIEWEAVRHLTHMKIVEPGTEKIVHELQNQGYAVMGLTTQRLTLAARTQQHLIENQFDLTLTAPGPDDHYFIIDGHGILFHSGILFTSGVHKGKALFALLEKLACKPKRILFINDKHSHLVAVETTSQEKGIEFIGLRYAYSDAYKAAFNVEIANFQFTHSTFTHLLSDEEAQMELRNLTKEKCAQKT